MIDFFVIRVGFEVYKEQGERYVCSLLFDVVYIQDGVSVLFNCCLYVGHIS